MNKKQGIAGILGILISLGLVGGVNMQQTPKCFADFSTNIAYLGTGTNMKVDIVLPNGDSKCNIILSKDNHTKLKENVGVFSVGNRVYNISDQPNTNYCQLAKWAYIGHLGYYDKIAEDFENYMFPPECASEIWGEFGVPQWYEKVYQWHLQELVSKTEIDNGLRYLLNEL